MLARIARIAITTKSSISVNAKANRGFLFNSDWVLGIIVLPGNELRQNGRMGAFRVRNARSLLGVATRRAWGYLWLQLLSNEFGYLSINSLFQVPVFGFLG